MRIVDADGNDTSSAARKEMGAERYDEVMRTVDYTVERRILAGPSDEEATPLRADYGFAPEAAQEIHRSRLEYELDLSQRLADDPRWRRGRLRDVVSAREVAHEWMDAINRVIEDRTRAGRAVLDLGDVARAQKGACRRLPRLRRNRARSGQLAQTHRRGSRHRAARVGLRAIMVRGSANDPERARRER